MLILRACDNSDIPVASQLMCTVYAEEPWKEKWSLTRAEKRITAFLSGINARAYAIILETQTIGYMFGRLDILAKGDVFYVEEIFVHPHYQRQGCGSMALAELARELSKENVMRLELHTIYEDIPFYEKNGFKASSYIYLEKDI